MCRRKDEQRGNRNGDDVRGGQIAGEPGRWSAALDEDVTLGRSAWISFLDGDDFVRASVLDGELRGVLNRRLLGKVVGRRVEPFDAALRDVAGSGCRGPLRGQRDGGRKEHAHADRSHHAEPRSAQYPPTVPTINQNIADDATEANAN